MDLHSPSSSRPSGQDSRQTVGARSLNGIRHRNSEREYLGRKRMTFVRISKTAVTVSAAAAIAFLTMNIGPTKAHAQQQQDSDQYLASLGLQIAPCFINTAGKDITLVGLGSFIVNGVGLQRLPRPGPCQ